MTHQPVTLIDRRANADSQTSRQMTDRQTVFLLYNIMYTGKPYTASVFGLQPDDHIQDSRGGVCHILVIFRIGISSQFQWPEFVNIFVLRLSTEIFRTLVDMFATHIAHSLVLLFSFPRFDFTAHCSVFSFWTNCAVWLWLVVSKMSDPLNSLRSRVRGDAAVATETVAKN